MPLRIQDYIAPFPVRFPFLDPAIEPWALTTDLPHFFERFASLLDLTAFEKTAGILTHREATIETGAIIKPPAIISVGCFVASTAYLRGGVVLDHGVSIGPGCELKSTIVMALSSVAHLSFVGDSIIGSDVNIEGGVVVANHFNELLEQEITVRIGGDGIRTGVTKFGALVGDHSQIGANAVLSPGTVLPPHSVVPRLTLVDQRGD
jgi:NDP-sugar pyrophosphorylase family protein